MTTTTHPADIGAIVRTIREKQDREWPRHLEGASKYGNPYATLCQHCFGRHKPPRDEICPNLSPEGKSSQYGTAVRAALREAGDA